MSEHLAVEVIGGDGHSLVAVSGEIDVISAPELRQVIDTAIRPEPGHLIVDLSGVVFIDSSGIGMLLDVVKELPPGSLGVVVVPDSHIRKVFAITGLIGIIPLFDSVTEAIDGAFLR